MSSFWQKLDKPIIGLAPMAGITDSSARRIAKLWGAELVYSEMVSSHGLIYRDKKSFELCRFRKMERPIIIQIYGREPQIMAEAALIIEKEVKADGVDINFGCPAKRVIRSGHGAALMDEPELAEKITKSIRKKISIPLSVKTRLGAKNKTEIINFAKRMEHSGVDAIAIHGRTLNQGYSGTADWKPIYKVKKELKIKVLGNGDLKNKTDIAKKLNDGNLDGVLIGRGAFGNPFIFNSIRAIKKDPSRFLEEKGFKFMEVSAKERLETIILHSEFVFDAKGERGLIELRKHLCAYEKGMLKAKQLRQKLVKVETIEDIKRILNS
jgi:nifR3 family TIM-barrel protein